VQVYACKYMCKYLLAQGDIEIFWNARGLNMRHGDFNTEARRTRRTTEFFCECPNFVERIQKKYLRDPRALGDSVLNLRACQYLRVFTPEIQVTRALGQSRPHLSLYHATCHQHAGMLLLLPVLHHWRLTGALPKERLYHRFALLEN
jgi:hypothetical protein